MKQGEYMTKQEMMVYLIQIGYHPDDVAAYSEEEIELAYKKETQPIKGEYNDLA